jgi:hypothetical protein
MVLNAGDKDEVRWSRLLYLFGSAEAIAFATVGWLFGSEVHRVRAQDAESRAATSAVFAQQAEHDRVEAVTKAEVVSERGRALALFIRTESTRVLRTESTPDESDGNFLLGSAEDGDATLLQAGALERLRHAADELFPVGRRADE